MLLLGCFTLACTYGESAEGGLSTFGTGPNPTTFTTVPADSGDPMEESDSGGDTDPGDTDPGDTDEPASCGDGQIDAGEACDTSDLDGETCETLGYSGGALACADDCLDFDVSGCVNDTCGNGVIDEGELCDGPELQGQTCQSVGFGGGQLACGPNCLAFDTSGCVQSVCGNGVIEAGEVCDGNNLGGQSCQTQGFLGGTLLCNGSCTGFNTAGCSNGSGDCCTENLYTGCQDAGITACVCNIDPYCCDTQWDSLCVMEAISDCGAIC